MSRNCTFTTHVVTARSLELSWVLFILLANDLWLKCEPNGMEEVASGEEQRNSKVSGKVESGSSGSGSSGRAGRTSKKNRSSREANVWY